MNFDVKVTGSEALIQGFIRLRDRDQSALMRLLGDEQIGRIKKRVFSGRLLGGGPMKPSIRASRDHGQTLVDKGHMLGGMKVTIAVHDHVRVAFPDMIQAKKAAWNQLGTGIYAGGGRIKPTTKKALSWKIRGGKRMTFRSTKGTPARHFFGFGAGDAAALAAVGERELQRALDKAQGKVTR